MELSGCITALVTPFDKNLQIDYAGLRENVRFQIKNGVSGLVPLGTTGESPTVTDDERDKIISAVVEETNDKVPVIVGTGTNSTEKTIKYTKHAKELGADAVLIVSPYYNKPTQEGLYRHFKAVSDSVDIPIIVYNIQGRTGVNIETPTLLRMSELENIVAVKEASGSIAQMMDVIDQLAGFTVLSGDDNMTLPLIAAGGKGIISVVSNLLPRLVSDMVAAALKGDFANARALHYRLMPIFKGAFIETNPIPIKTAMQLAGMAAGPCRLPLCEMLPQNLEKLKGVLKKYEELKIS
ncbi:MAG: 4-hydroxy-tetrahydrodipicolinate synthase [Candidatus Aenigmarchaeota archaeon]|nr:4-hydroxy-tetrahydrodipicolinate synthase [Candidatus Aenigmarchaeota archaeon]